MQALGLIETKGLIAAIEAADAMTKSANVELVQKSKVGGGLITVIVTGDVGAVKSAVEAGVGAVNNLGNEFLISDHVIPRPHEEVQSILPDDPEDKSDCKNNDKNIADINAIEETESDAKVITLEKDTIEEVKVDTTVTTLTENSGEEETKDKTIVHEKAEEVTTETAQNDNVVDINTQAENGETELPHIEETADTAEENKININIESISKNEVDKLVEEHGLDKAISILNGMKVTKLRRLAREYKQFEISGRAISKANKSTLIAKFKNYYKGN